ncbi:SDR family oxidoreductase [Dongia sp.]|uniref:SDR family oxidoreductase n=1 Tax=Dongia sp. TaxID=1977262 RepID=UPI0035B3F2AA
MRVFVTGASGFVGSAVVRDLIEAGHQVLGLARSDAAADSLRGLGAQVHRGDLTDLKSLQAGAEGSDGIVHCGFIHDFARFKEVCEIDRRVIAALGDALRGTERPLIVTSGTALVSSEVPAGGRATEALVTPTGEKALPRVASEEAAAAVAATGVCVSVMRLPPSVHGAGDHGFVPHLINLAREKGVAAYIGDGANRWPAVHRVDAARAYRLVLESGATERCYHANAEEGVPFREIAHVIGKRLGLPVVAKSGDDAAAHFGWFAHFAAIDNPTSSALTRAKLGWQPQQPGLIADLDQPHYFAG